MDSNATPAQIGIVFFVCTAGAALITGATIGLINRRVTTGSWKKSHSYPSSGRTLLELAQDIGM